MGQLENLRSARNEISLSVYFPVSVTLIRAASLFGAFARCGGIRPRKTFKHQESQVMNDKENRHHSQHKAA